MKTVPGLQLSPSDSVVVLLESAESGDIVEYTGGQVLALEEVAVGHKIAIGNIRRGATVLKYGEPIGVATAEIQRGEHVHVHNLRSARATKGEK